MFRSFQIGLLALFFSQTAHAQQWGIDFAGKDFFQLRDQLKNHYDSLAAVGDSSAFHEGGPYSRFRRWNEHWSLRLKQGTNFEDYFEAEELSRAALLTRAAGNTDPWYEIGPKDKPSLGQPSIGQGSQPGIGPIHFITFSDVESNKMLCGSVIGGLWYTNNQGLQWSNGGSDGGDWKRTGCKDAVFKVGDASTWYAANSGFFFYSGAILRGTNHGANWEVIADLSDFPEGGIWTQVNKLATDHEDPDVLYAATAHRLYRTSNVNALNPAWSEVTIPLPASVSGHPVYGTGNGYNYWDGRYVYDFEVDPANSSNLYATVRFIGVASGMQNIHFWRLMRSQDAGATWTEMPNQPIHPFTTSEIHGEWVICNARLMTIEMTKANPDWLYVFYDLDDPNPPPPPQLSNQNVDEIHMVTNAVLGTWAPPLRTNLRMTYGAGNGFGVDQKNGEDVYIDHNVSLGRYATFVNGVWTNYSSSGNYLQYHVDVEDFVGDPDIEGVIWMANHGGIHRSNDSGANWEWRGNGLAVAEVYRMKNSYSEPDRLITGLYHDASVLTEGTYGPDWDPQWRQLGGADGQQPLIEHDEGNWVYWSSQESSWRKSGDYGSNWQSMSAWGCASIYWETTGAMDHGYPNALYLPGWTCGSTNQPAEVKRSFDRGTTWEVISDFLTLMGIGRKGIWRMYSSPYDPNDLVVHFSDGNRVFRTKSARGNATAVIDSWKEIYVPRMDGWIADIDFAIEDPNVLYFAYSSSLGEQPGADGDEMLFKVIYHDSQNLMDAISIDLTNWGGYFPVFLDNQLPNTGVGYESVVLERGSNGGIYIATDLGVYYTNNELLANNIGWQRLGANLPHVSCHGLEINYKANKLRAGLEGRGVWEHDLWCPAEGDLIQTGTHIQDEFLERMNDITSTATVNSSRNITYRAGNQIRLLPGFKVLEGGRFHAFIHPCDKAGNSFKSMPDGGGPSVNENEGEKLLQRSQLIVYPNPNRGDFFVQLPDRAAPVQEFRLMNAQGRTLPLNWRASTPLEISLGDHTPAGMYLLRVLLTDGAVHFTKIVVQP